MAAREDARCRAEEAAMTDVRDLGREIPISLGLLLVVVLALMV